MPYYRHTAPTRHHLGAHKHMPTGAAPSTSIVADAAHNKLSPVDGPADYRPQMVPSSTRADHGQQACQFHQQQQRQLQQQYHQAQAKSFPQGAPPAQPKKAVVSAVTALLPYCTAEVPLSEEQVIAVTDVAGSMKELVLLALGAKDGDEECMGRLKGALGSEQAVAGVVDFFSDEFEI